MLRLNLDNDGVVTEIGYVATYNFVAPSFLDFFNYQEYKCIDTDDHMNPGSWIEIENIENETN
jgi:hypothetical protein